MRVPYRLLQSVATMTVAAVTIPVAVHGVDVDYAENQGVRRIFGSLVL